jgi:OPT family oligopeptide transporter
MALYVALYYRNVWRALDFPFLSQELFSQNSNSTLFDVFNQTVILDANNELNPSALDITGLPFFATTNASYLLTTNLGVSATVVHIFLWNYDAIRDAFSMPKWSHIRQLASNPKSWLRKSQSKGAERLQAEKISKLDPHYRQMLAYAKVPSWWYTIILVFSVTAGLFSIYILKSTLPWWGFLIACVLSFLSTLFFGAMAGLIGFNVPITSVIQLIGGYLHPGKPVANMYFVLFGANAQAQALFLIQNLKLGQYGKLSPKCTFTVQILGTVFGTIVNYVLMSSITTNQKDILLSIQGTNIWSGQVIQPFNSNVSSSIFCTGSFNF